MNTKQLKYVLTLAKEGSFSKAAEILNISQPSLSQYIKKIEREIGLELFDRTGSDVRITDAGRIYIDAGRKILDLEHQMENSFADIAERKTGSLIIGTAPYRAAGMMPAIAAAFQKVYPGMHLVVREGTTADLAEGMEHGEFDLAITLLPIDQRLFSYENIIKEEILLAVPGFYEPLDARILNDRRYPAIETEILNGKAFIMLTEMQYMQRQLADLILNHSLTVYTAAIVKSLQAQIEMVKAGVGMALVPGGIERFCHDSEVTFYSFAEPLPKREVVIMWRKNQKMSRTAEELKGIIHAINW